MSRRLARRGALAIRLALHGCTNRPFYHVVVVHKYKGRNTRPVEQLGTFDPMPNIHNEKLVGINFERFNYWMTSGAVPSKPVEKLMGLAGYFPIHPMTYLEAKRIGAKEVETETKSDSLQQDSSPS